MSGETASDHVLVCAFHALLGALALVLLGCAAGGSSVSQPPVEQVAQQLGRGGAASVIVFVSENGRRYVATAGIRRPSAGQRFRIGSVTKTFTATVYPGPSRDGLGIFSTELPCGRFWGHDGGIIDYGTTSPRDSPTPANRRARVAGAHRGRHFPASGPWHRR
jgi:D-alanyl-D-alanine carboxypeptidase